MYLRKVQEPKWNQIYLMAFNTREEWLTFVATRMAPMFSALDKPLPKQIRVAIGFTSHGKSKKVIGQCWDNACSEDRHFEIFIVPTLAVAQQDMPLEVSAILAHELVHAACGIAEGHRKEFRRVAKGIGLVGKMTATVVGPAFEQALKPILAEAGLFPHARLDLHAPGREKPDPITSGPKPQANRHIKCKCSVCGYVARTSRKWLDKVGPPRCPLHESMSIIDDESGEASPD